MSDLAITVADLARELNVKMITVLNDLAAHGFGNYTINQAMPADQANAVRASIKGKKLAELQEDERIRLLNTEQDNPMFRPYTPPSLRLKTIMKIIAQNCHGACINAKTTYDHFLELDLVTGNPRDDYTFISFLNCLNFPAIRENREGLLKGIE